jgi:hypothetical protein
MNFKDLQDRVNQAAVDSNGHAKAWEDDKYNVYHRAVEHVLKSLPAAKLIGLLGDAEEQARGRGFDTEHLMTLSVFEDGEFPTAMLYDAVKESRISIKDMLIGMISALTVDLFELPHQAELPGCPYCKAANLHMVTVPASRNNCDDTYTLECGTCGARSPEMPTEGGAWAKVNELHARMAKE